MSFNGSKTHRLRYADARRKAKKGLMINSIILFLLIRVPLEVGRDYGELGARIR